VPARSTFDPWPLSEPKRHARGDERQTAQIRGSLAGDHLVDGIEREIPRVRPASRRLRPQARTPPRIQHGGTLPAELDGARLARPRRLPDAAREGGMPAWEARSEHLAILLNER
jgi:hypothetical protein